MNETTAERIDPMQTDFWNEKEVSLHPGAAAIALTASAKYVEVLEEQNRTLRMERKRLVERVADLEERIFSRE